MKVGDSIGGLYQSTLPDGTKKWKLHEGKIIKIVQTNSGTKVHSKQFHPLFIEEIEDNTKIMEEANGYILVREVCLLTPEIRARCERWITWANANLDSVVGLLDDLQNEYKEDKKG